MILTARLAEIVLPKLAAVAHVTPGDQAAPALGFTISFANGGPGVDTGDEVETTDERGRLSVEVNGEPAPSLPPPDERPAIPAYTPPPALPAPAAPFSASEHAAAPAPRLDAPVRVQRIVEVDEVLLDQTVVREANDWERRQRAGETMPLRPGDPRVALLLIQRQRRRSEAIDAEFVEVRAEPPSKAQAPTASLEVWEKLGE